MSTSTDFYTSLAPYLAFDKIKFERGNSDQVLKVIVETVNDYYKSPFVTNVVKALSYGNPTKQDFVKRVFDYLCFYSGWNYQADPEGHEIIFTPQLLIKRGKGDCKKVTTFIASVLKAKGIEPTLKWVSYDDKGTEHVYVIVKKDNFGTHTMEFPGYLTVDPVNDCKWNTEVKHITSREYYLDNTKGTMNKISQMGSNYSNSVISSIGLSTESILGDAQTIGDKLIGGAGCRCNIGAVRSYIGMGDATTQEKVVMHDLVYDLKAPPFDMTNMPAFIQLYPAFTGFGLQFMKDALNGGSGYNNLPAGDIYIDAPNSNSGTGQYFMVVNGKRVNYMFTLNMVHGLHGYMQPGIGQSTLIYVGEAAKAQAATFVQQGKATLWDKVKAVVSKVEAIIKQILHVAAAGEFVIQRTAFLGLLKLGKALENTPIQLHLGQKMALLWAQDSDAIKKFWIAFGGDPAVLGKVILESAKTGVSGNNTIGTPTVAAIGEAIMAALPILVGAVKLLKDKGVISQSQADKITNGANTVASNIPVTANGTPAGTPTNPIVTGGATAGDNGTANSAVPPSAYTPPAANTSAGSIINFCQPWALNTWFKAVFLLGLISAYHSRLIVWQMAANAALGIFFLIAIHKLIKTINNGKNFNRKFKAAR